MASLETELGVLLLERSRRGVALTEVGVSVLQHAQVILAHTEQIRQEIGSMRGLQVGKLCMGSVPSAAARLLPGLIGAFRRQYPGIEVILLEGTDQEVQEWLLSHAIDLGIVAVPTSGLEFIPLTHSVMVVVLSAEHPLANQDAVGVEQIVDDAFIISAGGCEPLIIDVFRTAGLIPKTQFTVRDMNAILTMVEEGLGVTIVPEFALPSELPTLCIRLLTPPVRCQQGIVVRSSEYASPVVKAFIDYAQDRVQT